MKSIGIFVGEKGNWSFFRDIYDDINSNFQTDVFTEKIYTTPLLYGRLNRWAHQNGIRKILRHNDLCFFEWASELLVPASRMPLYCPIITRLHSYEIYFWAPNINWENVSKIIVVSQSMRDKFNKIYPGHAHKTIVVNNGVHLRKFQPREISVNTLNLGMLSSIIPIKRIYEIVLLLYQLKNEGYQPHLHIAGEPLHGPNLDEYSVALKRLIEKLDLLNEVTLYGYINDPASWLQNIDIFISNSYWEGQQVALLEALASGCYCLSHCWDGAEEILPPENIYVTEDELFEKIVDYFSLPMEEKRYRQARMRDIAVDKFDIQKTKDKIRSIITNLI
jgi:glycosyltransferase involved in cell wall biosynthesis